MTASSQTGIIILAAGASRRLGRPKQLLEWKGKTLLRRVAEVAVSLGAGPVAVVLGARLEQMCTELAGLNVDVVHNPDWEEGMSSSLRAGVQFLESLETELEAVLVLLVDQPRVDTPLLAHLITVFREEHPLIVASHYNGMNGVPAVFDASLFPELKSIEGDRGARQVILRHESKLIPVDFPGGAEDIDTEEAFWMLDA